MSNATEHSHSSGNNSRRRRSRGGKNRNNQNRQHDNRHDNRRSQQSQRSEEFRPQGPRPPRNAPLPPKLTFWQKILKAIGLYKAPAAPARSPQQPQKSQQQPQAKSTQQQGAPKSNTRNARSEGGAKPASDKPQGSGKRERAPRGDKPRGGDGSTVESPRVYVGNLSYDVTEQDLQELFKGIGPVRSVEIVYNRSTHRSKGYGFVEMLHKDEAVRSVEVLHDQPFMGRKLIVSGAKSKGQDEREDQEEDRPQPKVTLAPLPPAETVQSIAEPPAPAAIVESSEPVIQTIVETVAEAPAAENTEPENKSEIA